MRHKHVYALQHTQHMAYSTCISQVHGTATAGEIFGEIGVLCHRPQPFTFQTTELSQILRLNKAAFMNIIRERKEDGTIIMNNLFQVYIGFN